MTPENKALWTKALRSREYKQTKGTLKDEYGYCCLGVLCSVIPIPAPAVVDETPDTMVVSVYFDNKTDSDNRELPLSFIHLIDLSSRDQDFLIDINDGGSTFTIIADWIETNL